MKTIKLFLIPIASFFIVLSASLWAATNDTTNNAAAYLDDAAITGAVKAKIAADKYLSAANIGVTTNSGVVALSGEVASDSQVGNLVSLTESVDAVKDIDTSNLSVKSSKQPITDTVITGKVKGMFIRKKLYGDKEISAMTIHVETKNGVVYLTGKADNQAQANNAVEIANSIEGVSRVESTVKVKK